VGVPDLSVLGGRDEETVGLIRMDLNTAPGEPAGLRERFERELAGLDLERYGDESASILRGRIASRRGGTAEQTFVAGGSMAVLQAVLLAFGGSERRALAFLPGYSGLHRLCAALGTPLRLEARGPAFALDAQMLESALRDDEGYAPDLVFFCHPGNPTGRPEDPATVEAACRRAPGALVVVDEAYLEFSGLDSMDAIEPRPSNLLVVRSFSKAMALAGARVGYALGAADVCSALRRTQLPGAVSALTQAAALAALAEPPEDSSRRLEAIAADREEMSAGLAAVESVEVWPSSANFVLFRTPAPAAAVLAACRREGVLVRDVSAQPGLERCVRATVAGPEANARLLAAVAALVTGAPLSGAAGGSARGRSAVSHRAGSRRPSP
jgi:histidinol-phosphate aminotransferase